MYRSACLWQADFYTLTIFYSLKTRRLCSETFIPRAQHLPGEFWAKGKKESRMAWSEQQWPPPTTLRAFVSLFT